MGNANGRLTAAVMMGNLDIDLHMHAGTSATKMMREMKDLAALVRAETILACAVVADESGPEGRVAALAIKAMRG